jgi:ABC-type Fe3+-siderophore transport system permease subunit
MSSATNNTDFSFEYAVSVIITLVVCSMTIQRSPKTNTFVVILLGLIVSYISLLFLNFLFPQINKLFYSIYQYILYMFMNNFNNSGYIHVWPPILAVLIIFIVLLYNKNLG